MLMAWDKNHKFDFKYINSHEKTNSVRDTSKDETLMKSLRERINNSRNVILIISENTKNDTDWVPFEISYAVDKCKLPIIAVYPDFKRILAPKELRHLWPTALSERIDNGSAKAIHIPFKQALIADAISQFDFNNMPATGVNYYSLASYEGLGL